MPTYQYRRAYDMLMNSKTRHSLDFDRVLSDLLPSSPFGNKCKGDMKPYFSSDAEKLALELNRVFEMKELLINQLEVIREIKVNLKQIKDIRRSIERCINGGILNQVELFELKSLLFVMHNLSKYQVKLRWNIDKRYKIIELPKVLELLDPQGSGIRAFYIYDEYSTKLKVIRSAKTSKEQHLEQMRKQAIIQIESETGLKLKVTGEFIANKNQHELVSKLASCSSLQQTGETFINFTYKIKSNNEMADCLKEIEDLKGEELLEEAEVLQQISVNLAFQGTDILANVDAIGEFDLLIAKGELALRHNGVKPELSLDGKCSIKGGVNPIVQKELHKKGKHYMPISVELSEGVTLITGANMGGKTVSLKMVGLLACMAQYGLLVPACNMSFQPFDFIYISCGDEQSVDLGLSTFGGEIKSITEIISKSKDRGLVLLDELARGTNPKEGYAISYALIDYLIKKPSISLITTHLEGLEREELRHFQVKGLLDVDFSTITDYGDISKYMDYNLIEVKGEMGIPEDAIKIARIMGIPEEIITKSEQIMRERYK
jgi:DNA mismatch repair ATPase MutS